MKRRALFVEESKASISGSSSIEKYIQSEDNEIRLAIAKNHNIPKEIMFKGFYQKTQYKDQAMITNIEYGTNWKIKREKQHMFKTEKHEKTIIFTN